MLATRTHLPKPVFLTGLLAAALLIFVVPAGAADLPSPQGAGNCAYSGPTSLAEAASTGAPAVESLASAFTRQIHLGYGEAAQLRFEELQQNLEHLSFGVGDQQTRTCNKIWEQCGLWYRTNDCCFSPEADLWAKNCQNYWACTDGSSFPGNATYYRCDGAFCH